MADPIRSGEFLVRDGELAERLVAFMQDAAGDGVESVVRQIVEDSIRDVPIGDPALDPDPAVALRASFRMHWVLPRDAGGKFVTGAHLAITVDTDYAVKQHEALHFLHPRGGGAKFLERNVAAHAHELQNAIAVRVRTRLASGNIRVRGPHQPGSWNTTPRGG